MIASLPLKQYRYFYWISFLLATNYGSLQIIDSNNQRYARPVSQSCWWQRLGILMENQHLSFQTKNNTRALTVFLGETMFHLQFLIVLANVTFRTWRRRTDKASRSRAHANACAVVTQILVSFTKMQIKISEWIIFRAWRLYSYH